MALLSRASEIALVALVHFDPSGPGGQGLRIRPLAHLTRLPGPFLAKVLQRLARQGVLRSRRGREGGFVLGRPAALISLADVVVAIEGGDGLDSVFPKSEGPAGELLEPHRQALLTTLSSRTLADLASSSGEP
ncbi:MAG: Rrf2 family transcriptional regulator [Acidobacteria bacterium]|nr:Rrf2 family transcriptional regulator [Acidobacteriota bacterium]MCG3194052.1 putative HTH-type transcriptional regulator [Thermoanaerobaculia bacterium]MCK6682723.1 Rrf2 family transcriptional regulator [Thermoanaerobaculia bacterium]